VSRALPRPAWLILLAATVVIVVLVLVATAGGSRDAGSASEPPAASASSVSATAVATATATATAEATAPEGSPQPGTSGDTTAGTPLDGLLAELAVATEQRAGYNRALFEHWIDADGNGCNTRQEVLIEEAVIAPAVGEGCLLSGGTWFSLYDGRTFGDPGDLDIDHVVALAEAWDSGAFGWTAEGRRAYANDLDAPFALIAVSAGSNRSKSDLDPADWLPPSEAARCPFVGAWLAVKVRWSLAVDPREAAALASLVTDCPASTMLVEPGPTFGPPAGAATTAPSSPGACDAAYPSVCIPPPPPDLDCGDMTVRSFTVLAPDPHRFDGDRDGIGCET
jgi:hypothetical protein